MNHRNHMIVAAYARAVDHETQLTDTNATARHLIAACYASSNNSSSYVQVSAVFFLKSTCAGSSLGALDHSADRVWRAAEGLKTEVIL
jgi:hypothetical protein